MKIEFLREIIM